MRSINFFALLILTVSTAVSQDGSQDAGEAAALKARVEAAVKDLSSDDFDVRQKAQQELGAMGRRAHPHLKRFIDHKDPEVRLRIGDLLAPKTASPLRREVEEVPGPQEPKRRLRSRRSPINPGVEIDPFVLFRRGDFFGGGLDPRDPGSLHRFMEKRMQELMGPRGGRSRSAQPGQSSVRSTVQLSSPELGQVRFERSGDGIKLSITPPDGERKDYSAPNIETFAKENPEVYSRLKGTGIFQNSGLTRSWSFRTQGGFGGGGLRPWRSSPQAAPLDRGGRDSDAAPTKPVPLRRKGRFPSESPKDTPQKKPRLGATVREAPSAAPNGSPTLLVEKVEKGGVADGLGLKRGDVILRVNTRKVQGLAQLQDAVRSAPKNAMWSIWVRRNGAVRILAGTGDRAGVKRGGTPVPLKKSRDL